MDIKNAFKRVSEFKTFLGQGDPQVNFEQNLKNHPRLVKSKYIHLRLFVHAYIYRRKFLFRRNVLDLIDVFLTYRSFISASLLTAAVRFHC